MVWQLLILWFKVSCVTLNDLYLLWCIMYVDFMKWDFKVDSIKTMIFLSQFAKRVFNLIKCRFVWSVIFPAALPVFVTGLILGLCTANEKCLYKVTPSLIGWSQTYRQPCVMSGTILSLWSVTCQAISVCLAVPLACFQSLPVLFMSPRSKWVWLHHTGLRPANERWGFFVTMSFIGWVQA